MPRLQAQCLLMFNHFLTRSVLLAIETPSQPETLLDGRWHTHSMTHTIPQSFRVRKDKILSDLSTPDSEYTDKSPKGSIDEPIRDLIALINSYPGWCTTSSCSGRVAVFLEGSKSPSKLDEQVDSHEGEIKSKKVKTGPGGKGGGRWLLVSHDLI